MLNSIWVVTSRGKLTQEICSTRSYGCIRAKRDEFLLEFNQTSQHLGRD